MEFLIRYFVDLLRFLMIVTGPISELLLGIFYSLFYGRSKPLPAISDKVLLISAKEVARKIRKKEISAEDVMVAYINRIKAVQPVVNACVDNRFDEALADAKEVDRMIRSGVKSEAELAKELPLLGVPFSCKEIIGVKNMSSTNGLKSLKNRKAPEDSDTAALYRKAGAIPLVVTNIPTLCLFFDTWNPIFGASKNPYDTNRTVGGSSGGEGAIIASAGSVIGIGNDLGGSIRLPAGMCGIFGHKPSAGIISNATSPPLTIEGIDPYTSTGPMCRYAEDLQLLVNVLSGKDRDKLKLNEKVNFKKVKVLYIEEFPGFWNSAHSEVKAAVRKAVKYFQEEYNVRPTPVKIKELEHAFHIWQCKMFEAAGAFVRKTIAGPSGRFCVDYEYLKIFLGYSDFDMRNIYFTTIELQKKDKHYKKGLEMYDVLEKEFQRLLDEDTILIIPVFPELPPYPISMIPKFKRIGYTAIFNILGLPSTVVPVGLSKGLPVGVQVLAAKNKDRLTLAAAVELENAFGGWNCPSSILF